MYHGIHLEVKVKFLGIGSFLHHMDPKDRIQEVRSGSKFLYLLGYLTNLLEKILLRKTVWGYFQT